MLDCLRVAQDDLLEPERSRDVVDGTVLLCPFLKQLARVLAELSRLLHISDGLRNTEEQAGAGRPSERRVLARSTPRLKYLVRNPYGGEGTYYGAGGTE